MTHMAREKEAMTKKRSSDFGEEKCNPSEKILATPMAVCAFVIIPIEVGQSYANDIQGHSR